MEQLFGADGEDEDNDDPMELPSPVAEDAPDSPAKVSKEGKEKKKDKEKKHKKHKDEPMIPEPEKKGKKDKKDKDKDKKKKDKKDKPGSSKDIGDPVLPVLPISKVVPDDDKPDKPDKKSKKDKKEKPDLGKKDKKDKEKKDKKDKDKKDKKDKEKKEKKKDKDPMPFADDIAPDAGDAAEAGGFGEFEFDPADELNALFADEKGAPQADDLQDVFGEDFFVDDEADKAAALVAKRKANARKLLNPPKAKVRKVQSVGQVEEVETDKINEKFHRVLEHLKIKRPLAIKEDDAVKFVQNSIQEMHDSAEADDQCNVENKLACHKMKMLPKVVTIMNKFQFAVHFVTFDGCKALAVWMKNLPNGKLPNEHLRTELLNCMMRLPITKEALSACNKDMSLGKLVAELQNNPQETIENRKTASQLVQRWVKQVLHKKPDYDDLDEAEVTLKPKLIRPAPETAESLQAVEKASELRAHPSIPIIAGREYVIKPVPRHQPVKRDKVAAETNRGKLGEVLKVLGRPNKRSWKPYEVSVAGRTVNAI